MATKFDNEAEQLSRTNRDLRKALQECRELLKRTRELLERAQRPDQPAND
jgi:hypothetical protein